MLALVFNVQISTLNILYDYVYFFEFKSYVHIFSFVIVIIFLITIVIINNIALLKLL